MVTEKTVRIVWQGAAPSGFIGPPERGRRFQRGEPIEVTASEAKVLLSRSTDGKRKDWKRYTAKKAGD